MIYSKYRISLDIRSIGSQVVLMSKRLETGREIYITLTEGLKTYTITDDCYAVFAAIKPDGNFLFNFCRIEDNTIIYTYTPQTTITAGKMECEIRLYSAEGEMLTSASFGILISETIVDEGEVIESAFESTTITKLVEEKVTEYMMEHPIATDTTLSDPEAAANAKATGDAISTLSQQTTKALEDMQNATNEALEDMQNATNEALEGKVDKEENKALSTNDFTDEYKEKLEKLKVINGEGDISVNDDGKMFVKTASLTTAKYTRGSVTREKLANDALFSPVVFMNTSGNLAATHLGKKIVLSSGSEAISLTVSKEVSDSLPLGFEAIVIYWTGSSAQIEFSGGLLMAVAGESAVENGKVAFAEQYGMAAITKISDSGSWLVTGAVEVVS